MAIGIKSVTVGTAIDDTATVSVTTSESPSATQVGDLVVVVHSNDWSTAANMPTPTATGSPTLTPVTNGASDGGSNAPHVKSYTYVANTGGAQTISVTEGTSLAEKVLVAYVLSGADTSTPVDVAGNNTETGPTSHVLNAISPSQTNSYLVAHIQTESDFSGGTWTSPGTMSERYETTVGAMEVTGATEQLSASGSTGTRTFTSTANHAVNATVMIAIRTASGGGAAASVDNPTLQNPVSAFPIALQRDGNPSIIAYSPNNTAYRPPIGLLVWTGPDPAAVAVSAEIGTGTAAAAATATEKKVAVQGGSCATAAAGTAVEQKVAKAACVGAGAAAATGVEKKVAVSAGSGAAAAVGVASEKKVAPQAGLASAAGAGSAVEVRVVAQAGSCAAAGVGAAVHTVGVPPANADDPTLEAVFALYPPINEVPRVASEWAPSFARVVWFGQDTPSIPTAAESGTGTAAAATTAVEKKVAVQSGSCAAGPAGVAVEKKVAPERGVAAAAAAGASVETSGSVAIERGTATAAAAATSVEKKVAVQGGSCAAGPAATGTSKKTGVQAGVNTAGSAQTSVCRKVAKATGTNTAGASVRCTESKRAAQAGRVCAAATSTSVRGYGQSAITRVFTGSRRQRASTGANRQRASTGNVRQRITTEIG